MRANSITRTTLSFLVAGVVLCSPLAAQEPGVFGYWREPTGSVIEIDHCGPNGGSDICARLVSIRANAPSRVDIHNPDPSLRTRSLCGLRIGEGFHLTSPGKAEGGTLYDPKSGKTYRGAMSSTGDHLDLRGYVGLPIFGRSETWTRTTPVDTCKS